jgi:hypothetical protein
VIAVFRLFGRDWTEALSLGVMLGLVQVATVGIQRHRAHRRGAERASTTACTAASCAARPDDLADHTAIEQEIAAAFRGGIWVLILFWVVFSGLLVLSLPSVVRGDESLWWIVLPAGLLALGLVFGVRMVCGSNRSRRRWLTADSRRPRHPRAAPRTSLIGRSRRSLWGRRR